MHTTLNADQIAADTQSLDWLIAVFERRASQEFDLLLEHLKSARTYLLGRMPNEYALALEMSRDAASALSQPELRYLASEVVYRLKEGARTADSAQSVDAFLRRQNPKHQVHKRPRPHPAEGVSNRLWNFFGQPPTSLGTFYPTSYVTAVLPSSNAAEAALKSLRDAGFDESETIVVSGTELIEFFDELRKRRSIWGELMARLSSQFSRMIGTEQLFEDFEIQLAHGGAAFLLVYSPDDTDAERVREMIMPFGPLSMQRYLPAAVEGMITPAQTLGPEL